MSRMDITLAALYGGKRVIDTDTQTVLRRAFIPWTYHTWGFEYESESVDGYRISDYSALNEPLTGRRHHIITNNYQRSSTSLTDIPYLRIRENTNARIWNWIDKGVLQGDGTADQNIILDVEVCADNFLDDACTMYPNGNYKPTGLLHTYGEDDSMYFSLLTGSFANNIRGGVLRSTMQSFTNEIDANDGTFSSDEGIVQSLNSIQIPNQFSGTRGVMIDCTWLSTRKFNNGECRAWGNPVAEMMFEGMRYLAGTEAPTPMFHDDAALSTSLDTQLGLPAATWDDPYSDDQPWGECATAHQLVISDPSPSFDGDQLPGSYFDTYSASSLGTLDVGSIADFISAEESELPGLKIIGEADGNTDQAPSAKMVTTLKTVRGQAPEATHREGSYYASSVAYYGNQNDIHPTLAGDQTVSNYTLALGSPLPTIEVDVSGQTIQISPYGRTVHDYCGNLAVNRNIFAPTGALVRFVVEEITDNFGSFRVSIENMEQGGNNDNDANIRYSHNVVGNELVLSAESFGASGCAVQHLGYSISGTTADGIYLVVRDQVTTAAQDVDFVLDVPPGEQPGTENWDDGIALPLSSTITFTPSDTPAAETLESPLWYAAKWGGFDDMNGDGIPQSAEWDSNNDGDPDNYFRVTNPSLMVETMAEVFESISKVSGSIASTSVSGSSLSEGSRIFESRFSSDGWFSELSSRAIHGDGTLANNTDWEVSTRLAQQIESDTRTILTYKPSTKTGIAFQWPVDDQAPTSTELDLQQIEALSTHPVSGVVDGRGSDRLDYLRGNEINGFRQRSEPLGDIINSSVQFVGPPSSSYPDNWGENQPESEEPYSDFMSTYSQRQQIIYVGANDGMLHAFNAGEYTQDGFGIGNGEEVFAYVPAAVYEDLPELTNNRYFHRFYVDAPPNAADVFINDEWRTVLIGGLGKGGQGIYALDITDAGSVTEEAAIANATVLWEFTDEDDAHLGYTYTSPLITRMHNGKWVAIFGNGYNADETDGHPAPDGLASIFIVDIETGALIKKLHSANGTINGNVNAFNAPTAVDLDNDNIVDVLYVGDIHGVISKFDVSSSETDNWERLGDQLFATIPRDETAMLGELMPVTSQIAVGRHPTGEGVLLFFSSGQYLEPSDLRPNTDLHRFYSLWDPDPFAEIDLRTPFLNGEMLEQSITAEQTIDLDTDGDGIDDASAFVRQSSQHAIDWDQHKGWYMDLEYLIPMGEQVVVEPLLRESFVVFNTYIATGDICTPSSSGWLMVLNAASGAMPDTSLDLNGDGNFSSDERISGISSVVNPFSSPTIAAGTREDVLLSTNTDGSGTSSALLDSTRLGRASWRELKP